MGRGKILGGVNKRALSDESPGRREPEAPWPEAPRLCPDRVLPAYRFVPGLNPHPVEHPAGHSHGGRADDARVPPDRWRENKAYLYGIDLYHQGYYWEAHEAWEGLWRQAPRPSLERDFLQGLILNSAAQLKAHLGSARGCRRLSRSSEERLERVRARVEGGTFMGLDVSLLLEQLRRHYGPLWRHREAERVRLESRPPLLLPADIEWTPRAP